MYVFYERKGEARNGAYNPRPASGIFSERVLRGGKHVPEAVPVPVQQQQPGLPPQQQGQMPPV